MDIKQSNAVRLKSSKKAWMLLLLLVSFLMPAITHAATQAASIAQGYSTNDQELAIGMAASLSTDSGSSAQLVVRAATSNKGKFVGIVTTKGANLVTLTNNIATVVVTTSGEANALLTDINGVVKKGDYLTVSPIKGLLMRANEGDASIIGTSLEDIASKPSTKQTFTTNDGSKRDAKITAAQIEVSPNSIASGSGEESTFLRVLGRNIAGKSVNDWQAVIALVIFLLLLVVEGSMIYGAIHSTITALGRNPMAREAVYKQLLQVVLAVLAVLAFGLATIYAVLQI